MTFTDLEKAYESVQEYSYGETWFLYTWSVNIREKWINVIKKVYTSNSEKIECSYNLIPCIPVSKRLKQGYVMSPILFNIDLERALQKWYRKCTGMGSVQDVDFFIYTRPANLI